jgi:hypothetical protein
MTMLVMMGVEQLSQSTPPYSGAELPLTVQFVKDGEENGAHCNPPPHEAELPVNRQLVKVGEV